MSRYTLIYLEITSLNSTNFKKTYIIVNFRIRRINYI